MKKTYVSPLMVEVNVEAEQILAASIDKVDTTLTVDQAWSKENNRGTWGNLWQ